MKVVISSGHGKKIRGASGYLDEVDEARRVVERVANYFAELDVGCTTYHDNQSTTQDENLKRICDFHNSKERDFDISVHFNAHQTTSKPMGTEVWYRTQEALAENVSMAIADAGDFIDRGPKHSTGLYFLNHTEMPAILLEICFVDSSADAGLYKANFDLICQEIAEAVSGKVVSEGPEYPVPAALTVAQQKRIKEIASGSPIASYSWKDRGVAPRGFTQGMALAFAQSYLKLLVEHPAVWDMARARHDSDKDALNIYRDEFDELSMSNERPGANTLRHLYALMMGHGMRESSGKHCEGRDMSAENVESETCEAGLFQTSYNAHSASDPEFVGLMNEYDNEAHEATCYLEAFAEGVSCDDSDWSCYGSGQGYVFQELCKDCPAFACETAALTLRNLANHYGPIIRKEVELRHEANTMLRKVQDYIDTIREGGVVA
jgi:hypothetical protein